jgi:hypothetical protein
VIDHAFRQRLDELATDVGRLGLDRGTSSAWIGDRIACHVEALILMIEPTAAELAAWYAPGDDDAVAWAIEVVDKRHLLLRQQLGRAA